MMLASLDVQEREEVHSIESRRRYGLEEQLPTLVGSFCFDMRI